VIKIYYQGIVGSHLFGSITEHSDIDYLVIAKEKPSSIKGTDMFYAPPEKLIYYTFDTIIPDSDK
jgi:predicted nucleotidyltransferase